jgi:DNA polymerase III alpha subunit
MQVKGAREIEVQALLAEREANGPFADPDDLLARVKLSLPTVEALCAGGAFDRWAPDGDRTRLLWTPLGGVPIGVRPRPTDPFDRADQEMDILSLTLEIHPAALARFRQGGGPNRIEHAAIPGRRLHFWALVVAEKRVLTEKDDLMQFITFEDETGLCEAVAFPQAFARRRRPFRVGDILPVRGLSTRQDGLTVLEVA